MTFNISELKDSIEPNVRAMNSDPEIIRLANELFAAADRYDWPYHQSWLGVPVLQTPEDLMGIASLITDTKPNLIVETGVAYGGLSLYLATICELVNHGQVIGIDINLTQNVIENLAGHRASERITLIKGDSVSTPIFEKVAKKARECDSALIILDSSHTHEHVFRELQTWSKLEVRELRILVTDTILQEIPYQKHRPRVWNQQRNPATALAEWLSTNRAWKNDQRFFRSCLVSMNRNGLIIRTEDEQPLPSGMV